MGPRSTVLAGLLAGVATTVVLLVAAVFFLPEPPGIGAATPTPRALVSDSPGIETTTPPATNLQTIVPHVTITP